MTDQAGITLMTALIAAGATVLGGGLTAFTAFYSSRRASEQAAAIAREQSERAAATAREQRRYERVHEMRSEVLPKLDYTVQTLYENCDSLAAKPLGVNEAMTLEEAVPKLEAAGELDLLERE